MTIYIVNLLSLILINGLVALSLDFILTYGAIYSMAQAIFFGIGAYSAAYVSITYTAALVPNVVIAMTLASLFSILLAAPALRVREEYFIAASLGFQILGLTMFMTAGKYTGGLGGISGIPSPTILGFPIDTPPQKLLLILVAVLMTMFSIRAMLRGSYGRSLRAIRESESACLAHGKSVLIIKLLGVVVSSSIAATAGVLYAYQVGFVNTQSFGLEASVIMLAIIVVGGAGSLVGPFLGSALVLSLPSLLSYLDLGPAHNIGHIQQIIFGALMLVIVMKNPGGLAGLAQTGIRRATDALFKRHNI